MLTSTAKRYVLPFSDKRSGADVESASVFTFTELSRSKGGGLIARQPEEKLTCLAKVGYPVWFYPKDNRGFLFDGLARDSYSFSYMEVPPVKDFIESLESNAQQREHYETFLSDHINYFQSNLIQKKFALTGLISDVQLKADFNSFRKEAVATSAVDISLLMPSLQETAISAMLGELEKIRNFMKEEAQKLPDCLRLIGKTTSQYLSELDFQASAATEEADAKIKAQEQVVNPQIIQLNKDYSRRMKETATGFDTGLERLEKLHAKTERLIERNIVEGKGYAVEAKAQAAKGHKIYERRWKDKIRVSKKELEILRKELSNIEKQTKQLAEKKKQAISQLTLELDREVKLARQPLQLLLEERESKLRFFKLEKQKLLERQKPVVEGIDKATMARNLAVADFDVLSTPEASYKTPSLFFVPFYVACYEAGLTRRVLTISPSTLGTADISAKLKSAFGLSKLGDLLIPRFSSIHALIMNVEDYSRQNSVFESQLWDLCFRSNLLKNNAFRSETQRGLVYLKQAGWLSQKEQENLSKQLTQLSA